MEIESGLPPPLIRLQTKVLSALTRTQTLATNHPIREFLTEGLHRRTAAVKHRANMEKHSTAASHHNRDSRHHLTLHSSSMVPRHTPAEATDNAKHMAQTEKPLTNQVYK